MILGNFETFLVSPLALNSFQNGRDFGILGGFCLQTKAKNWVLFDCFIVKMVKSTLIFWHFTLKQPFDPSRTHILIDFKFLYFICPLIKLKTTEI